jgi:hypothetical protein
MVPDSRPLEVGVSSTGERGRRDCHTPEGYGTACSVPTVGANMIVLGSDSNVGPDDEEVQKPLSIKARLRSIPASPVAGTLQRPVPRSNGRRRRGGSNNNTLRSRASAQARRPTRTHRIIVGNDVLQGMTVKERSASSDHYVSSYYPRSHRFPRRAAACQAWYIGTYRTAGSDRRWAIASGSIPRRAHG